jgi:ABC-type lipoprotein release transport system permease subunit
MPRPYLYTASLQADPNDGFVIRTAGDPAPFIPIVRREALALNPELPILELKTMREHLSLMLTPPRLAAAALGVFGTLAILLASPGLYAVVAFSVVRRTKEIGIRVALGATGPQIMRLVVSEGMVLVAVGIAVGFVLAAFATRPLDAYLYGLNSFDPVTFASVAALLAGTALIANYLPARRALRVDPLKAIRYE